jgi:hypothetical protein
MTTGNVVDEIPLFARTHNACCIVTDFSPLRHSLSAVDDVGM